MNFLFKEELDTIGKLKVFIKKNGLKRDVLDDVKFIILHKNNINGNDYTDFEVKVRNIHEHLQYYYVSYNYSREEYTFEDLTCNQIDKHNIYYIMGNNL